LCFQRNLDNQDTATQARQLGRNATIVQCDLTDKAQVGAIVQKVTGSVDAGGLGLVVDILVNCGGIQRRSVSL
jgi:2-deoxy-D-gluconate 3-dehydrogenase